MWNSSEKKLKKDENSIKYSEKIDCLHNVYDDLSCYK